MPITQAPPGWTNADTELSAATYWGRADGKGIVLAKIYGLDSPAPVMRSTRASGSCLYMFKAAEAFYIWNELQDEVWKITYPTTKDDILSAMMTDGDKALTTELLEIVD